MHWLITLPPAPDGTGNVLIPGAAEFSHPVGEWFKVEHLIDLDADNIEIWIDGVMVYTGAYTGNIGSVDFYSIDADCRYYIDDVLLTDMMPVTGTGAYYINSNTTGGEPWFSVLTWMLLLPISEKVIPMNTLKR